jgi:hypothetical protein
MPLDPDELERQISAANEALQTIQRAYGKENVVEARVQFPRGFIGTASGHRSSLPNLGTEVQRRNASYALMSLDVHRWLAVRTTLSGAALSMVVKEAICTLGALAEWMTKEATRGNGSQRPFTARAQRLVDAGTIDAALKAELDWLWTTRCKEHLGEVDDLEHTMYSRDDYNRARRAYARLRDALVAVHGRAGA